MNGQWTTMAKPWLAITTLYKYIYITKICTHTQTQTVAAIATAFCLFGPFQTIHFRFAFLLLWINCFGAGDCFSNKLRQLYYYYCHWFGHTHNGVVQPFFNIGLENRTKIAQGLFTVHLHSDASETMILLSWDAPNSAQIIGNSTVERTKAGCDE